MEIRSEKPADPLDIFAAWLAEAEAAEPNDPTAMALATLAFFASFVFDSGAMLFGTDMLSQAYQSRAFAVQEVQAGRGLPLAAGVTLYVAASDLIPEVNHHGGKSPLVSLSVFAGVAIFFVTHYLLHTVMEH